MAAWGRGGTGERRRQVRTLTSPRRSSANCLESRPFRRYHIGVRRKMVLAFDKPPKLTYKVDLPGGTIPVAGGNTLCLRQVRTSVLLWPHEAEQDSLVRRLYVFCREGAAGHGSSISEVEFRACSGRDVAPPDGDAKGRRNRDRNLTDSGIRRTAATRARQAKSAEFQPKRFSLSRSCYRAVMGFVRSLGQRFVSRGGVEFS